MDARPRRRFAKTLSLVLFVALAGCTWLVKFDTESPDCGGNDCADAAANPDVPVTPPPDSGEAPDVVKGDTGSSVDSMVPTDTQPPPPDSAVLLVDSGTPDVVTLPESSTAIDSSIPNPCAGQADGTQWNVLDGNARCCGGQPVETTTDTNCGVCGLPCNTGAGQACMLIGGEYLCSCTASADCWSDCCANSGGTQHCSASNCAGACQSPDVCATYGAHCVIGEVGYCSY